MTDFLGLEIEVPQIVLRPVSALVPYDKNSRTHSPFQVSQLEQSLLEYGWTNAILIDDMGVVAGHGRLMAAKNLYQRGEQIQFPGGQAIPIGMVPTIDCSGWSPDQRRAYIIADNRSALDAGWDTDILADELRALDAAGFDLDLTFFDESELTELLVEIEEDPEELPASAGEPDQERCQPGDIWQLGEHRLACGDATDPTILDSLMSGKAADILLTDPPYNVDLDRKNRLLDKTLGGSRSEAPEIKNDKMTDAEFLEFLQSLLGNAFTRLRPGATVYLFHSDKAGSHFRRAFDTVGFKFGQSLIWVKNNIVLGPARYQPLHEPIIFGYRPGKGATWNGKRKQKTVIEAVEDGDVQELPDGRYGVIVGDTVVILPKGSTIETLEGSLLHSPKPVRSTGVHQSAKPPALLERLLKNSGNRGDVVLDVCAGSGSTLFAAMRCGMTARLVELEPRHCDAILGAWEAATGQEAELI